MPMWRCPHCGTPQPEAARCWVCRRSSTTCSTCRHFRPSLAASIGYCGIDPNRSPLQGTEHRGCWAATSVAAGSSGRTAPDADTTDAALAGGGDAGANAVRRLRPVPGPRPGVLEGFVPIELASRPPRTLKPADPAPLPPPPIVDVVESWTDRETLFGDA